MKIKETPREALLKQVECNRRINEHVYSIKVLQKQIDLLREQKNSLMDKVKQEIDEVNRLGEITSQAEYDYLMKNNE